MMTKRTVFLAVASLAVLCVLVAQSVASAPTDVGANGCTKVTESKEACSECCSEITAAGRQEIKFLGYLDPVRKDCFCYH